MRRNRGAPCSDGMRVEVLGAHLQLRRQPGQFTTHEPSGCIFWLIELKWVILAQLIHHLCLADCTTVVSNVVIGIPEIYEVAFDGT